MVLRELRKPKDAVLCIGQPAHALLAGRLARAWGNGLFPAPWPREEVVLAAEQHDLGMAGWDAEPELDPETGRPRSFLDMALETHLELWGRAPWLALSQSRWAGLLVSMHGSTLYGRRAGEPGVREFLDAQAELQRWLVESLGVGAEQAARNQRLLAAWDRFSLALCLDRLPETVEAERSLALTRGAGEGEVRVAPWPFSVEAVDVSVEGRVLVDRFDDQVAMRDAFHAAPWRTLSWSLRPA
ncbi:MAG TPA: DUF3891 family protein [Solirubrobacteraceae bacterium]|nr:DUF3891 family protein [Solirubrobacteraceae bacterium]